MLSSQANQSGQWFSIVLCGNVQQGKVSHSNKCKGVNIKW